MKDLLKEEWEKHKASKDIDSELERSEKAHKELKQKDNPEDPEINYEQRAGIIFKDKKKLEEGRKKQGEIIVNKIVVEDKLKEDYEKEIDDKKIQQMQKDYINSKKENDKFYVLRMDVISHLAMKKRNQATELIVNDIEENNYIYTTRDDVRSEIWIYNDGIYKPQGKTYIMEICRKILNENFTSQIYNEILNKIEADTFIEIDEFFKNNNIDEIPLQNGILHIKTRQLSEFTPKKIFFNKLPIKYDKNATCKHIEKFFKDILKEEDDSKVMFELFGYCLWKEYKHEKAFMFLGNGRNGKGKTLSLMKKFLGAENCCSVPLSQINPSSTSVCELHNRLVNLAGDLSNTDLKDTGTIKQVTGRDLINAKRKFLRDLIFVNYAKLIFACNELPRVYDMSEGFWSRWLLLEFPYKFISEKEYNKLKEDEKQNVKIRDEDIIEKISTEKEMSGLLNKALESLDNLNKNHDFEYSKGTKEVKDMWIRQADSFVAFCLDHLEENPDGHVTKQELRRFFSKYCKKHKVKGSSDKNIKVILENNYGVIEIQLNIDNRERIWSGITLKNLEKLLTAQETHLI